MRPDRRTPKPAVSVTAQLAARFNVSVRLAQLAVSRGVHRRALELVETSSSHPRTAFIAAVNVLLAPPRLPRLRPLSEVAREVAP